MFFGKVHILAIDFYGFVYLFIQIYTVYIYIHQTKKSLST